MDRELIARIIDPVAFSHDVGRQEDALGKADAIMALRSNNNPTCQTCGGRRTILIVNDLYRPDHEEPCPVCVGWLIPGLQNLQPPQVEWRGIVTRGSQITSQEELAIATINHTIKHAIVHDRGGFLREVIRQAEALLAITDK